MFADVDLGHTDWEVVYDADGYLALLDTFGHIAMQPLGSAGGSTARSAPAGQRPDGTLRRHWEPCRHVAQRVP